MKSVPAVLIILFLSSCMAARKTAISSQKTLFQYGVIDGLLAGAFDGNLDVHYLIREGDFGIGTFNKGDGELIALGPSVYKVKFDGKVIKDPVDSTPFAAVTKFIPDTVFSISSISGYDSLQRYLKQVLNLNSMYAIKLSGSFDSMTMRAIAPATKPYPTLTELVLSGQQLFHYEKLAGDCIGFFIPDYLGRVNVPGFHFHFLSDDRTKGGHVFDLHGENIKVSVQELGSVVLRTNTNRSYMDLNSRKDRSMELKKIE